MGSVVAENDNSDSDDDRPVNSFKMKEEVVTEDELENKEDEIDDKDEVDDKVDELDDNEDELDDKVDELDDNEDELDDKVDELDDNEDELDDKVDDELDLNMTVEAEGENNVSSSTNKIIIGKKNPFPFKKKKKTQLKPKRGSSGDEAITSDEVSSSETDGEIDNHEDGNSQVTKLTEELKESKLTEIQLPVGDPITVISIKQEYDEDDEVYAKENMEPWDEKPVIKEEEKKQKVKTKKVKIELSEADLPQLNMRFQFTCQICMEKLPDSLSMQQHMSTHDQIGTYMCGSCQRVYQDMDRLKTHMLCHIKGGSYRCELCNKVYHHSQSLMSHRKRYHRSERPFACDICGKTYSLKNDLNTHMRSHGTETFPCLYCDKTFRTDRYLRIHTKHIHLGHKFTKVECKICHKSFQKKNLLTHMRSHEGKMHKCHYCGKSMTTAYSLMTHIRRHEGIKPFACQICDKAFVDKGKLVRHVHSHKGTRDFQCDICEKSFSESQYLRQHKRTHDVSKEYPCRICGTKFKSMNSVWSHMRKHTHSDRYECHFCGKTCYRPDHLRSHLISHTGIKEYQCEICSKRFAKSYDLTEHRRGHSGERPYNCKLCNRSFARHGEFRKHKMCKYHREREIEAGLPVSYPAKIVEGRGRGRRGLVGAYHCPPCGKRFATAPALAAHMRRKSHQAKGVLQESVDETALPLEQIMVVEGEKAEPSEPTESNAS